MAYFVYLGFPPEGLLYLQFWSTNFVSILKNLAESETLERKKLADKVAASYTDHVKRGSYAYEMV